MSIQKTVNNKKITQLMLWGFLPVVSLTLGAILGRMVKGFRYSSSFRWIYQYGNLFATLLFFGSFFLSLLFTFLIITKAELSPKQKILWSTFSLLPIWYLIFIFLQVLFY